jgi:DNA polymerase-3 subunit epsilon
MANIFWFDLETTDNKTHRGGGIWQIAYIIEIDGQVKTRKEFKMKPFKNDLVNAQSLSVCGVTYEQIMQFESPSNVLKQILSDITPYKKLIMGGFNNAIFDNPFFMSWWYKASNEMKINDSMLNYFYFDALDVRTIALNKLIEERKNMEYFQQKDVARKLGIQVDESKLHDALYDVELCINIYNKTK